MPPEVETKPVVWVIDDDDSLRKALARLLRAAGYDVVMLSSAQAFIEREDAAPPDCLLLDVRMPVMSGLELHRRIAVRDRPPVVIITAHEDPRVKREAMEMGAVDFLLKPLDYTLLLDAVERAVQRSRLSG
jgi:two-component system, LuxR family, response regulator FixJ